MASGTLVLGLFDSSTTADRALSQLYSAGVTREDLSVVAADEKAAAQFGIAKQSKVGEGAAIGAGVLGALGAALAGFAAVGAIATGGAGVIIAGPLVAALAGAGAGAATGGIIGGLVGLGIPEHEVHHWADKVKKGSVLIGVKAEAARADNIKRVFEQNGATRITTQSIDLDAQRGSGGAPVDGVSRDGRNWQAAGYVEANGRGVAAEDWAKSSALHGLFIDQLRDIYYAEHKLADALASVEQKASSPGLAQAIRDHRAETQTHIARLNEVFQHIGVKPDQKTCPAINGIITEAKELMKMDADAAQRDAALICACQKAEHYEIGTYGCLRTYARTLGLEQPAQILEQTLEEEWNADRKLTELAESGINQRATAGVR
jgi:ferritin-like metal-binding protein YciE